MRRESSQGRDASRIESFSDNVFAIALTLLVLTIKVPAVSQNDQPGYLVEYLRSEWPAYLTYVVSFLTVLLMWINHHVMFQRIQKADHALMFLNGLMLLPVTLVSFPTALLAVFFSHPQARYAAALFSGSYVMIAGFYYLVWAYITRMNFRLGVKEDAVSLKRSTKKIQLVFGLYVGAFCVAFIHPVGCIVACLLLCVYFALPQLRNSAG